MPASADPLSVKVNFNAPQASDDYFTYVEGSTTSVNFDVMANDSGGAAKSLFSITEGSELALGALGIVDLSTSDVGLASESSELGATISIINGQISYNTASIAGLISGLSVGEELVDHFTYAIRLGNGTLSLATVTVTLVGTELNDDPQVVFSDNFNRPNNGVLGNGWVELRETYASDPNFFGSADVAILNGSADFRYVYSDGDGSGVTQFQQPYVYHNLAQNLAATGFEMQFDFTPDQSGRVRQVFGMADGSSGVFTNSVVESNPLLLPQFGIAIEIVRTNTDYANSGIKVWQLNGANQFFYEDPAADELKALFQMDQFQFDPGTEYHFEFSVDAAGHLEISVTNGILTEFFFTDLDTVPTTLDQVFLTSTETGTTGTESILVDDFILSML